MQYIRCQLRTLPPNNLTDLKKIKCLYLPSPTSHRPFPLPTARESPDPHALPGTRSWRWLTCARSTCLRPPTIRSLGAAAFPSTDLDPGLAETYMYRCWHLLLLDLWVSIVWRCDIFHFVSTCGRAPAVGTLATKVGEALNLQRSSSCWWCKQAFKFIHPWQVCPHDCGCSSMRFFSFLSSSQTATLNLNATWVASTTSSPPA